MIDPIGQADLIDECSGQLSGGVGSFAGRSSHQRRNQNVFKNRALGQQVMILEDEPDGTITKIRQLRFGEDKWIFAIEKHAIAANCRFKFNARAVRQLD